MKVTYLLGAGASYKAVPTIVELNGALLEINKLCGEFVAEQIRISAEHNKQLLQAYEFFNRHITEGAEASKIFGTIDTYAKKLSLTESDDLEKLKVCLGIFFTIWQDINKDNLKGRFNPKDVQNNISYQDVDDRYFGLIANYLVKEGRKLVLDEKINFISWNYDTQLERAISSFTNSSLKETLFQQKAYPYYSTTSPKIVHLNGIAGLFEERSNLKTLFNDNEKDKNFLLNKNLSFLSKIDFDEPLNTNYFTYAWEDDNISKQSLKFAEKIISETNILVIIGYSFPTFNDLVDKKLFKILKESSKLRMVYYQDPNASVELLNSRFGLDEKIIKIVKDVNQFILPLDSHSFSERTFILQ